MAQEQIRKSRLVRFLGLVSILILFCSVMSIPGALQTKRLATNGVSTIGTLTGITPPAGHIGATFQYVFKVNENFYYGASSDWRATQTSTYVKARVGNSVIVSYLPENPGTNQPGNPRDDFGLECLGVFFMIIVSLTSGYAAIVLCKKEAQSRVS